MWKNQNNRGLTGDEIQPYVSKFDYVCQGPMASSLDSIPLGNGDVGVNLWAERDALYLLLSKTDAFNEWGELLKLGLVRISSHTGLWDSPSFHLDLYNGVLEIRTEQAEAICFMGPHGFILQCEARNELPLAVEILNLRKELLPMPGNTARLCSAMPQGAGLPQSADQCGCLAPDAVFQYHRNEWSSYQESIELQGMGDFPGRDPLLHRTFGFIVQCNGGRVEQHEGVPQLVSPARRRHQLHIRAKTLQEATGDELLAALSREKIGEYETELLLHQQGWHRFWERSYIFLEGSADAQAVTKGYLYQRYMNRCGGSGAAPVKFNGSIFTVHPDPKGIQGYDYRQWGGLYWLQNTRLIYWSMLYSGDFELMLPFFQTCFDMLPVARYRVRRYFHHEGALIPETTTFYGLYANDDYGYERTRRQEGAVANDYIARHYNGQLEIAYMMLQYYGFTRDEAFLQRLAVPFVFEVLTFFDQHFRGVQGQFYLKNVSSLETWQDCINDTPDICGLMAVCDFVCREEAAIGADSALAALCRRFRGELPALPIRRKNGTAVFAPCEFAVDKKQRNSETPELYGVFPYDLFGCCGTREAEFEIAKNTFQSSVSEECRGWRQDSVFAARLGLAEQALAMIVRAFETKCPECAFPAYWGPNYDWIPDQCHGNVASIALTQMLVQSSADGVKLFPAWSGELSVRFRLPVYGGEFVTCACEGETALIK